MKTGDVEIKYTKLFINNEFVDAVSKKTFPTLNPANEKIIANVSAGDKEDIDIAVAAAKTAFARNSEWRTMRPAKRVQLMNKFADLIERDLAYLTALESLNAGKLLLESELCIRGAIDVLRYYAGYADKIVGYSESAGGQDICYTVKEPIGVIAAITPFNYPIYLAIYKWAAAFATGCTIVSKPADQTPLTTLALAALAMEAGFPKGVVNVVTGFGPAAGEALSHHNDVRMISFTGSTKVGKLVAKGAAESNLKRVNLELGGKNPLVVCDDVDVDEAVKIAHMGAFANQGQVCIAGSRTFVHSSIYDEFVKKSVEKVKEMKIGNQFEEGVTHGPQIDKMSMEKILKMIEIGVKEGAKLEIGGKQFGKEGYFAEPTVFSNVTDDMTIAKEEIFGPVQSILKFETLEEVIERANNTDYGLSAGILTKDTTGKALVFTSAIEAGIVWVNCYMKLGHHLPFGGYKQSGLGREGGVDALDAYLEVKSVTIAGSAIPKLM